MNKAFVSEYEKAYKVKPDVFAALAYDSALLVAEAIKNAGDTDPVKIAQSMAKINGFQGVSGTVTFDAQHNPVKSAVIIEHKDGAQTFRTKSILDKNPQLIFAMVRAVVLPQPHCV